MNGRIYLALLVIALSLLSGCTTGAGTSEREYHIYAHSVDAPPANATVVVADDSQIQDVQPIQTALSKALEEGDAMSTVTESEYETAVNALDETPLYRNDGAYITEEGLYVRVDGRVFRVSASWSYLA